MLSIKRKFKYLKYFQNMETKSDYNQRKNIVVTELSLNISNF